MTYMGNKEWWNKRFKSRKLNIMNHEKGLEEDMIYFPKSGEILDVACGDGRNSIYLAKLGYEVTAIDFSKEALNRLRYFIKKEGLKINTELVDLSKKNTFINSKSFDAIIINHYKLNSELYSSLMNRVNKNGVLWVNGFREIPKDNPNITDSDIFCKDEFIDLNNYKMEYKKLYEIGDRKFIRCMWRK